MARVLTGRNGYSAVVLESDRYCAILSVQGYWSGYSRDRRANTDGHLSPRRALYELGLGCCGCPAWHAPEHDYDLVGESYRYCGCRCGCHNPDGDRGQAPDDEWIARTFWPRELRRRERAHAAAQERADDLCGNEPGREPPDPWENEP